MREDDNRIVTIPFSRLDEIDTIAIGEKARNLGVLTSLRLPVPNGYVVTSFAFDHFAASTKVEELIQKELASADVSSSASLENASKNIRRGILRTKVSDELRKAIQKSYGAISGFSDSYVAIRSSKIRLEDSYEGKFATYLNVRGKDDVVEKVKYCWASVFSPDNIFYSLSQGETDFRIGVIIQKMIQAEVSGVMFTRNPIDNDPSKISIECVLGLGEALINGDLTPDTYLVDKQSGEVEEKKIVPQEWMLVRKGRTKKGEDPNVKVKVGEVWKVKQKLEKKYIDDLVKIGKAVEDAFNEPQEIEWTYEGGRIWIVQSRPMQKIEMPEDSWKKTPTFAALKAKIGMKEKGKLKQSEEAKEEASEKNEENREVKQKEEATILQGEAKVKGEVTGKVKKVEKAEDLIRFNQPTILVADHITADFEGKIYNVVGIVVNKTAKDFYETILSKSLEVPCVVNTEVATNVLREDELVTIKTKNDSDTGIVLKGETEKGMLNAQKLVQKYIKDREKKEGKEKSKPVPSSLKADFASDLRVDPIQDRDKIKTATKVFVDIYDFDAIGELAQYQIDGVGSVNSNKLIERNNIHPGSALKDEEVRGEYVNKLVVDIYKAAKLFENKPVIYRLSDMVSSKYSKLEGGERYEVTEWNPKLGMRGASRYSTNPGELELELEAIKILRNKENLKNISIAIPFVRTFSEIKKVKKQISAFGFRRSSTFNLYCVVQVPACAIRIEKIIGLGIDGVIVDLGSLSQGIFSLDESNPKLAVKDEAKHPATLEVVKKVVKVCNKEKIHSQVLTSKPDQKLIEKLVEYGVTSVSTKPGKLAETRQLLADQEGRLLKKKGK